MIVEILDRTEADQPQVRLIAGPGHRAHPGDAEVRGEAAQVVEGPVAARRRQRGGDQRRIEQAGERGARVQGADHVPRGDLPPV
jgi:hypothetical protein